MPHHSRNATTTASAMSKKPSPSRRCSGVTSRPDMATLRAVPPAACDTPIQADRTARTGIGIPPLRALVRLAGADARGVLAAGRERALGDLVLGDLVLELRARPLVEEEVPRLAG